MGWVGKIQSAAGLSLGVRDRLARVWQRYDDCVRVEREGCSPRAGVSAVRLV